MNLIDRFLALFRKNIITSGELDNKTFDIGEKSVSLPILPGGSALPTTNKGVLFNYGQELLQVDYPIEFLRQLEHLSIFHPQVSLAVANIKIANTPFQINFSENNSSLKNRQMKEHINTKLASWFGGGANVLTSTLFRQLAVKGCISVDRVIAKGLNGIERLEFINPYTIRFVRDNGGKPYPVQIGALSYEGSHYGKKLGNSYIYIPLEVTDSSPYGLPLFLSVIDSVCMQSEMWQSFKSLLNKIGVLGIYKVLVKAPDQNPDETEQSYVLRVQQYIKDTHEQIKRNSASGVLVGLKDQYEAEIEGNNVNAAGAEQLFKIVNLSIYQSLNQDPNMMGESYTVSEAFAKVILKKMTQQHKEFQQRVASFLEQTFMMELLLAGFSPRSLEVVFEDAMPEDKLMTQQILSAKIANVSSLITLGIIDVEQAAQELGYDSATSAKPLPPQKTTTKQSYDYSIPKECDHYSAFPNKKMNDFAKKYVDKVETLFDSFINSLTIVKTNFKSAKDFQKYVMKEITKKYESEFLDKLENNISPIIKESYSYFRSDKKVFTARKKATAKQNFFIAPQPLPNFFDTRVQNYLLASDLHYLGKILTDTDVIARLNKFIEDYYNSNYDPNSGVFVPNLEDFAESLANELQTEKWKISRIVNTTINKIRSNANVLYMQQAKVEKYEVIEVNDRITCPYCKHIDGMTFTVKNAVESIKKELDSPVDELPPFATANDIDIFKKLTNTEVEKLGINRPPFHPNCRGTLGAIIE
jgi:SPP1 gp7 family putative phage head morphogenesis protein